MGGSRGGGARNLPPPPPLKSHKNIGFLNNTGLDPLKFSKLPSQQSMWAIFGGRKCQALVVFGSSPPPPPPPKKKKKLSEFGPLWHNFLDLRMRFKVCYTNSENAKNMKLAHKWTVLILFTTMWLQMQYRTTCILRSLSFNHEKWIWILTARM